MNKTSFNEGRAFMKRALQLSLMGAPNVSPNPMVGAVIVADGRIIGEGYHRMFGEAHAEVNAINSVAEGDRPLLKESTMYVTLEPCSHYGKTPPCSELIIRTGIPRVVVAVEDPFLKDKASGIDMMRAAGIEVEVGLMREEALQINRRFFTAHSLKRPFVLLKWAQSADGFMARKDGSPVRFSSDYTQMLMHRERSLCDAIMVGTDTVLNDNPSLNCRLWPCRDPRRRPLKVTFDSPRLTGLSEIEKGELVTKRADENLGSFLHRLFTDYKIISLMIEGGSKTLNSFIREGLFDEIRIETAALVLNEGIPAPSIDHLHLPLQSSEIIGTNRLDLFSNP